MGLELAPQIWQIMALMALVDLSDHYVYYP